MRYMLKVTAIAGIVLCGYTSAVAQDQAIDASDPTKIYTYMGGGLKYVAYTNGESMIELRTTGNLGLSDTDMILFELGYGWHDGDLVPGDDSGWTNARARWLHVVKMSYDVDSGYRGWSTQVDLQLAGALKGTDGQNVLAAGIMPTYALNEEWNLYLGLNAVGAWDKGFKKFNGAGVDVAPNFVYSTEKWWPGAQVQLMLDYKYFLSGSLEGEGDATVEVNVGGEITPTIMWDVTGQKNFKLDLTSLRRGVDTGLKNDWNIFLNVTAYF